MYYQDDTTIELEFTTGEIKAPVNLLVFSDIIMEWKRRRNYFLQELVRWSIGDGMEIAGEFNNILRISIDRDRVKNAEPGQEIFGDIRFIVDNNVSTYIDVEADITHSVTRIYNV